jgi:hypothetical protein
MVVQVHINTHLTQSISQKDFVFSHQFGKLSKLLSSRESIPAVE